MSGAVLLGLCILFSAGASILLKLAATTSASPLDLWALAANPFIWAGGISYAAAFLGYANLLRVLPLSLVQPTITAGACLLTALTATLFFQEHLRAANWLGLLLICAGIFLLFWGRS